VEITVAPRSILDEQLNMSQLFSPYSIGKLRLGNRIVIAPMCQYSAENGEAIDWHLIHIGQALRQRACSFIHVSSGGVSPLQKIPVGPGYQVSLARQIRAATGLPTIAVGLITEADQAEAIIAEGNADMVALARGILFDPRWPWHAAAKLGAQVDAPKQYWRSQP
jgi:2,4-dienoyl-CoA reductase-like NADH-dependent reductase (Old Yellow Enzyme family)